MSARGNVCAAPRVPAAIGRTPGESQRLCQATLRGPGTSCAVVAAIAALIVALMLAGAAPARADRAGDGAESQVPFPALVESVLERGSIEGHPVSIVRFVTRLAVGDASRATARAWGREVGSQVAAGSAGGWQIVSTRQQGRFLTLQLRTARGGGSEGVLSVWPDAAAPQPAGFDAARLLPGGAAVVRRVGGVDGDRRHQSLVAIADGSPGWNADLLESAALASGFTRDGVEQARVKTGPGRAMLYRSAGRELGVTVHPYDARTAIVLHVTETLR